MTTRQVIKTNTIPTLYNLFKKRYDGKIEEVKRNISASEVLKITGERDVVWFKKNFTDDLKACMCEIIV